MVHPFGVARVSSPQTVSPLFVAPMTSVAMPAELRGIPATVSQPVRLGDDFTDWFQNAAGTSAQISRIFQAAYTPATAIAVAPGAVINPTTGYPYYPVGTSLASTPSLLPLLLLGGGLLLVLMLAKR